MQRTTMMRPSSDHRSSDHADTLADCEARGIIDEPEVKVKVCNQRRLRPYRMRHKMCVSDDTSSLPSSVRIVEWDNRLSVQYAQPATTFPAVSLDPKWRELITHFIFNITIVICLNHPNTATDSDTAIF